MTRNPKNSQGYQASIQCCAIKWPFAGGPMMARLELSPLINYKLDLDQKRRRNASIRINSLFVATIRIDW